MLSLRTIEVRYRVCLYFILEFSLLLSCFFEGVQEATYTIVRRYLDTCIATVFEFNSRL